MAVIISSTTPGSIKVFNTSASPQSSYWDNLSTVNVYGSIYPPQEQDVILANNMQQVIMQFQLSKIASIGTSASPMTLQTAVDALHTLISH